MDAFLGEIRLFPFAYAPVQWMPCQGQLLQITQYSSLFALLGATFGGDGKTTFALPDLQGQVVVGAGEGEGLTPYAVGQSGGTAAVALSQTQMPRHNHAFAVDDTQGVEGTPSTGGQFSQAAFGPRGKETFANLYNTAAPDTTLADGALGLTGDGAAHDNMQPYLAMTYCICVVGPYPQKP